MNFIATLLDGSVYEDFVEMECTPDAPKRKMAATVLMSISATGGILVDKKNDTFELIPLSQIKSIRFTFPLISLSSTALPKHPLDTH